MNSLSHLSDSTITNNLKKIAAHERTTLMQFLDYLAEVEARRLYAISPHAHGKPDKVSYLTETRVHIKFSAGEALHKKLKKVKELAKGKCSDGNLEAVINSLCEEYLDRHDPERKAERQKPARTKPKATKKPSVKDEKPQPNPLYSPSGQIYSLETRPGPVHIHDKRRASLRGKEISRVRP
ncbi:MAG: hypothetical protein AB7T49_05795 [Oligoflexales bacterium]